MCGIVGYIGPKKVVPVIIEGLRTLEYRGYDSAGIAVVNDGKLEVRRAPGKLRNLEEVLQKSPIEGTYGIGHTRWATHGRPTEENAHPHRDCTGQIVVVHNGIIENYVRLKHQLEQDGHKFITETDTEVIAHLVESNLNGGPLEDAVRKSVKQLTGVYSLAILSSKDLNKIVAARLGPPSVIGLGQSECFVASDIPAILHHTRELFFLADGDLAVLSPQGVHLMDIDGRTIQRPVQHVTWTPAMTEKCGYKHFMQKEIFEQPRAVRDTLLDRISSDSSRVCLDQMDISEAEFRNFNNIKIVACGTSWHAGHTGKFMIERLAKIPVVVDYGSEFRYRDPMVDSKTLTICISQSGETADTLAAQRESNQKGSKTIAICNVAGSAITREAAGTILTHAGPEIGVASTKAFTSQLTALMVLAMYLGQVRDRLNKDSVRHLLQEFTCIPHKMETILRGDEDGIYEDLPVVALATRDNKDPEAITRYEKSLSNIKEVKARDGIVISIVTEGDQLAREASDHIVTVPPTVELLSPLLEIVPLQLLAYYIAVRRGCDVDQPRNLAKSVTVE